MMIPGGMVEAARRAVDQVSEDDQRDVALIALAAGLKWLVEHPIEPSVDEAKELQRLALRVSHEYQTREVTCASCAAVAIMWQQRMFEGMLPEIPEPVKKWMESYDGQDGVKGS